MPSVGASGSRDPPSRDTPKVYLTSYGTSYSDREGDSHRVKSTSYLRRPGGTGFTANQRPALYYSPSLDHVDNPQFGLMLSDSFMSQTQRHYRPRFGSDFSGSLPNILNKPRCSGFHQLWSQQNTVSPVRCKNQHRSLFGPHHLTPTVHQNFVVMGPKGETGFTKGSDLEFYTFQEKHNDSVEARQTPGSAMKNDFLPPSAPQASVAIPDLRSRSCRETGFTRGAVGALACPSSLLSSPQTKLKASTEKTMGKKELTGFLLNAPNHQTFPSDPFDGSHFITQYKNKFCRYDGVDKLRSVHAGAGITGAQMDSGYNRRGAARLLIEG